MGVEQGAVLLVWAAAGAAELFAVDVSGAAVSGAVPQLGHLAGGAVGIFSGAAAGGVFREFWQVHVVCGGGWGE